MASPSTRRAVGADDLVRSARGAALPALRALLPSPTRWPVWLIAFVTVANGLASLWAPLIVRMSRHPTLAGYAFPLGVHHWGRLASTAFGLALLYLAYHLLRRRRVAWGFALVAASAAVIAHLLKGDESWPLAVAPGVLLALLIVFRGHFTVRSEPATIAQGVALAVVVLAVAFAYGVAGFWLLERRDFGQTFDWREAILQTLDQFLLLGSNYNLEPETHHAVWFLDSLRIAAVSAVGLVALALVQPIRYRLRVRPRERDEVRALLERYGGASLDEFKLWDDKSYFFDDAHRAAIAYRATLAVAVALGDPVGDPAALRGTIEAFSRYVEDNSWSVAFHQVTPALLDLYRDLGFAALKIGEEASVDLERFATVTAETKDFRYIRRRYERDGYTTSRHEPPHSAELMAAVESVSREWLSLAGRRERGFTLGAFDHHYLQRTPLVVLRDAAGAIQAFVNEIPSYRPGEATIDLMRHREDVPNGVMDYLFTMVLLECHERGFAHFSLGMAPFAGVGEDPGATLTERAVREIFERLNRLFSYRGLRNYKAKFDPDWEDRFLVYRGGPVGLARTALALTRITEG
jgi:phosphatidylglycerol lysyltransferase